MTRADRHDLLKGLAWTVAVADRGSRLFTALPIGLAVYYSLCDYSLVQPAGVHRGRRTTPALARDPVFWQTIWNTLSTTPRSPCRRGS